jgi:hypothetical protein
MTSVIEDSLPREAEETREESIQVPQISDEVLEQSANGNRITWPFFI